jgi:DNA-directed RNA polymerase specialized sigma24 family protein
MMPQRRRILVQEALLRVYQSVRHPGLVPEDWYAYLRRAVINEYVRTRRLRSSTEIVTDVTGRSRRERVRGRHQPGDGRA